MKNEKTVKMSTRSGKFILLEDVLDRASGEVVLRRCETDKEQREIWGRLIGSVVNKIAMANREGEDKVTLLISDYFYKEEVNDMADKSPRDKEKKKKKKEK